jgi:branched-chain amino acid aminotransferase
MEADVNGHLGSTISSAGQTSSPSKTVKSGFQYQPTGRMFVAHADLGRTPPFEPGGLVDLDAFELHPAAAVLSYGVSCFEGLKAFRQPNGAVALFRPDRNAQRLMNSAEALGLPPPPAELFLRACTEVTRSCLDEVPQLGQGSLYLRPILFGIEPLLGVAAGKLARFHAFASPVGNYFAGHPAGLTRGLKLRVQEGARVPPGGLGNAKCAANYAATLRARRAVHDAGDDEALYLDSQTHSFLEESASSNVFAVLKDGRLVTPALSSTILPGITRESLLTVAREDMGLVVEERPIRLTEVLDSAAEFFLCGTAVVVGPVASINHEGRVHRLPNAPGPVTLELRRRLVEIQEGRSPDRRGWLYPVG